MIRRVSAALLLPECVYPCVCDRRESGSRVVVTEKRWNDCVSVIVYGNKRSGSRESFFEHEGIPGNFYVSVCISGYTRTKVWEKSAVSMFKVG